MTIFSRIQSGLMISLVFLLLACAQTSEQSGDQAAASGGNTEYEEAYNKAMASYKQLAKEGGAWTITEETLEKAQEAAKKNDFAAALNFVKEAEHETQIAMKQFESQKSARPYLF